MQSNYADCEGTCYMIISQALFLRIEIRKNLTSFFHVTLEAVGLEVMLHSKYTSSPSLISDASKFEPKDNPTTGGSVENNRNW